MSKKVNVYIRVRNPLENEQNKNRIWFLKDNLLHRQIDKDKYENYLCYRKVFYEVSNEHVYNECIKPYINTLLNGKSLTVFAYGQTGSGKTHTMTGNKNDKGIITRALEEIYETFDDSMECFLSYFEIYNENIIDLINTSNKPRVFTFNNELIVKGIEKKKITALDASLELIAGCEEKRKIGQTQFNLKSSRSHTIFKLEIQKMQKKMTLTLIDLAGSEKAAGTSLRIREGVCINKSLLALGKVISSLNKNEFTSYRESKLTRVLQSSMSGEVTLVALCMISPHKKCLDESISTLNFASRLCQIEMKGRPCSISRESETPKICERCKKDINRNNKKIIIEEISESTSTDEFDLINTQKVKTKIITDKIIDLQVKRIRDLESMIITLLNQNPSQRENEIFMLEKSMFNLQLEMLDKSKKKTERHI